MVEATYGSAEGEDRAFQTGRWNDKDCKLHRELIYRRTELLRGLGFGPILSLLAEAKQDRAPRLPAGPRALRPGEQLALPPASDETVYRAAFAEGVAAHAGGGLFGACPYPEDGPEREGWRAGWWR